MLPTQYAPSRTIFLEEHIVIPAYTKCNHKIESILCRTCIIPTQYALYLMNFDTQIERRLFVIKFHWTSVCLGVLLYARMCVRLPTIPVIRMSV